MKYAVITISDSASLGTNKDLSGPKIIEFMGSHNILFSHNIVPDDVSSIVKLLNDLCDNPELELILTTGGTGIGPRDVTPEATKQVIDYEIPGIPEIMRVKNYSKSSYVALSRALAGVSNNKLIINLPGSPKAVQENLEIIYPLIKHALELINGNTYHEGNKR